MSKRYNIRWRKSDESRLRKSVQRFNAKRTRIINKYPSMQEYLPDKLSIKDIKADITYRTDFNKRLNSIDRFMKKGAEKPILTDKGIKTTRYEAKEIGIKVRAINIRKANERKKANVSTEKGTMGTIKANNLLPKKYNLENIKKTDWDKYKETVEKLSKNSYYADRDEKYKENYIKAFKTIFGEKGNDTLRRLEEMSTESISRAYYDDPILQLDFIYDPIEADSKLEAIGEHLDELEDSE